MKFYHREEQGRRLGMRILRSIPFIIVLLFSIAAPSEACWFFYHESKIEGTLLDIDTKQPIEGAVIVVEYEKRSWFLSPSSNSSVFKVKETLTDKNGHFRIPCYVTLLSPISWHEPGELIIFKAGYVSLELRAAYFTGEELKEEEEHPWWGARELKYKLRGQGIVELPKVRTREERIISTRTTISGYHAKDLPLLYRVLNEERRKLDIPDYH